MAGPFAITTSNDIAPVLIQQNGQALICELFDVSGGTVTAVTASAPLASSGGPDPNISLTGIVSVANGGTGAATHTAHAVLVGEGGSAIAAVGPGAANLPLLGAGAGADPAFAALPLGSLAQGGATTGQVVEWNGTTWVAATPAAGSVTAVTGTAPIVSSGGATPAISLTAPSRAYGVNSSGAVVLTTTPQTVTSATLTPRVSGKIKLLVTGLAVDADSGGTLRPLTMEITDGVNTLQIQPQYQFSGNVGQVGATMPFAFAVDSDHAVTTPTTYPLGTPVTFNVVMVSDASGQVSIPSSGCQLEAQEALA